MMAALFDSRSSMSFFIVSTVRSMLDRLTFAASTDAFFSEILTLAKSPLKSTRFIFASRCICSCMSAFMRSLSVVMPVVTTPPPTPVARGV